MKKTEGLAIWGRGKSGLDKMNNFYFGHNLNLVGNHYGLKSLKSGAPGAIRTRDPRLRRPILYPTELRVHKKFSLPSEG